MADFEYKVLTDAEKFSAVQNRLRQLEIEHYQRALAYLGISKPVELNEQLDILQTQIIETQKELQKVKNKGD